LKSNSDLSAALASEEALRSSIIAKVNAVRAEVDRARAERDRTELAFSASKGRTGEAKGVLASLAAQLVQLTGRHEALSKDLSSILEAVLGEQGLTAQLQVKAAAAEGLASAHAAVADVGEAEIRGLNAAISTLNERISIAESTKFNLTSKLTAAKESSMIASNNLKTAEKKLEQEQLRHERIATEKVAVYAAHQDVTARSIEAERSSLQRSSLLFGSGGGSSISESYLPSATSPSMQTHSHVPAPVSAPAPVSQVVSAPTFSAPTAQVKVGVNSAPAPLDDTDFGFSLAPSQSLNPPELPHHMHTSSLSSSSFSVDSTTGYLGGAAASGSSPEDDFSFGAPASAIVSEIASQKTTNQAMKIESSTSSTLSDDGFGSFSFDADNVSSSTASSTASSSGFDDFAFGDDSSTSHNVSAAVSSSSSSRQVTSSSKAASTIQDDTWNF
jgi:hypothetical protein